MVRPIIDRLLYLLTRTSIGADFFTKHLHSRWRCARTPSDRSSLAVNSYGRSWGSSQADTEQRHNMRLYTCVHGGVAPAGAGGALSVCACACVKYVRARRKEWLVLCPIIKNEWNKWKNHFYKMKVDVGINVTS